MNWISIKDLLPTEDGKVLIFAESADPEKPMIDMAWFNPHGDPMWTLSYWCEAITHWMPLPKPPEEPYTDGGANSPPKCHGLENFIK